MVLRSKSWSSLIYTVACVLKSQSQSRFRHHQKKQIWKWVCDPQIHPNYRSLHYHARQEGISWWERWAGVGRTDCCPCWLACLTGIFCADMNNAPLKVEVGITGNSLSAKRVFIAFLFFTHSSSFICFSLDSMPKAAMPTHLHELPGLSPSLRPPRPLWDVCGA